mmetsp:Transcript_36539/g.76695  ORF Transcript_36539/g.76695 Transcript_36539/m.76695 type:complete len:260 (+) Transcript_36539:48-827(+)
MKHSTPISVLAVGFYAGLLKNTIAQQQQQDPAVLTPSGNNFDVLESHDDTFQCPPTLTANICSPDKLATKPGYYACAESCAAALCCQAPAQDDSSDGQGQQQSCMTSCGSECSTYLDCLNLSDMEPTLEEKPDALPPKAVDQCPPGLPFGVCGMSNIETAEGFVTCKEACSPALCCMPPDGQPDCLMECSGKCIGYQPCLNLSILAGGKEAKAAAEGIAPKPEDEEGEGEENDAVVAGWTNIGIVVAVFSVLIALPHPF